VPLANIIGVFIPTTWFNMRQIFLISSHFDCSEKEEKEKIIKIKLIITDV
jgi:hypothetical protein